MKKLFALIVLVAVFSIAQADNLTDAIIESDVEKVQECISKMTIVGNKYLEIAKSIMDARSEQRTHSSPLGFSVPGTMLNKVAMMMAAIELVQALPYPKYRLDSWWYLALGNRKDAYYGAAVRNQLYYTGVILILLYNANAIQHKKVKYLDQKHKDAIYIYQLMYEASIKETKDVFARV